MLTNALIAVVFLSPLIAPPFLSVAGVLGPALVARFAIIALLLVFVVRGGRWPTGPLAYLMLAYGVVLLITAALGVDFMGSLAGTPWRMTGVFDQLLWLLFAGMLPWLVRDRWRSTLQLAVVTGAVLALLGIAEWLWWPHAAFAGRIMSLTGNPGLLGVYLMATVPVAVGLSQRTPAWFGVAGLVVVALHLTGTRTAILGALVALVVLAVVLRGKRVRIGAIACAVALVGFQVVFGLTGSDTRTVIPNSSEVATTQRADFQGIAWQAFTDRPLTGWGPGQFIVAHEAYEPEAVSKADNPHNFILQEFAEKGVLALVTFALLGVLAWELWKVKAWVWLAVLASLSVYSLAWFLSPHMLLWLSLVMGLALVPTGVRHVEQQAPEPLDSNITDHG